MEGGGGGEWEEGRRGRSGERENDNKSLLLQYCNKIRFIYYYTCIIMHCTVYTIVFKSPNIHKTNKSTQQ